MKLYHIMVITILMTLTLDTEVHGLFFNRLYEAKKNFFFPSTSTSTNDVNCSHEKESCQMVTRCQPRSRLKCYKYDDGTLQQVCRLETDNKCLQVPECRSVRVC